MMSSGVDDISMMSNVDPRCLRICQSANVSNEGCLLRRELGGEALAQALRISEDMDRTAGKVWLKRMFRGISSIVRRRASHRNLGGRLTTVRPRS